MRVIIVSNGELGDLKIIGPKIPDADFIISSDGGTRYLKDLKLKPDLIVGDFDSIDQKLLKSYVDSGVDIHRYSSDKDRTDTHIAVDTAVGMGAKHITLLGALGSRWDHSFANVLLLVRLAKQSIQGVIMNSNNTIMVSDSMLKIKGSPGDIVSLLPLGDDSIIENTQGLKYKVSDSLLPIDFPIGVSNVLTEDEAIIKIKSGWVIGIIAQD